MNNQDYPSKSSSTAARLTGRLASLAAAVVALASVLTSPADAQAQRMQRRELELIVGEQTSVPTEGVRSYSEGTPGIVDVRVPSDGTQFIVVGLAAGTTTLLLLMENGQQTQYTITVRNQEEEPTGIQPRDNIRLDFYFVQLEETYGHDIGVGWPASIGGGGAFRFNAAFDFLRSPVGFANATAVVTNQPLPRIDMLEASGWARVVRQAAIITANGNQATFASGGEINVPVVGALSGELKQIEFGSTVTVLPRYDRQTGRLELQLTAEVSNLSDDRGTGIPGRNVSNIETLVNLEMGQSVVLGGLIAETNATTMSGLPGLSQIPILGILFGTHSTQRESTQNVLFIVPTVVDVVAQRARERIAEAVDMYWDYSGDLEEVQLVPTPAGVPSAAHPDGRRSEPAPPAQR